VIDESSEVEVAREALRARLAAILGPAELPRLEEALTHPSYANETGLPDNQRLEFLGDSVLGLCVSEMLAEAYTDADEGKLTRMRSSLVNGEALAAWARGVGLGACLAFGRGAKLGTEREQSSVLADATEALVAAVYEARGLDGARALVREMVGDQLTHVDKLDTVDPKSALQERVQARGMPPPTYRVVEVRGSPHEQVFAVEVLVGTTPMGRGEGRSKRVAERQAAADALASIGGQ
jgi:ribonuclease-3